MLIRRENPFFLLPAAGCRTCVLCPGAGTGTESRRLRSEDTGVRVSPHLFPVMAEQGFPAGVILPSDCVRV